MRIHWFKCIFISVSVSFSRSVPHTQGSWANADPVPLLADTYLCWFVSLRRWRSVWPGASRPMTWVWPQHWATSPPLTTRPEETLRRDNERLHSWSPEGKQAECRQVCIVCVCVCGVKCYTSWSAALMWLQTDGYDLSFLALYAFILRQ